MERFFNIAGPCVADQHYMLDPELRIPGVRKFIEQRLYFVIHAPRQVGKTTCFRTLAERLNAEARYTALHATCETGQAAGADVERGVSAVLRAIEREARHLPAGQQPEPVQSYADVEPESRLVNYLTGWAERAGRPVLLFLDEIDALIDDTLISVLRQLRSGYPSRPGSFPQSVALIGLRDVRDYRLKVRPEHLSLGTASPFNIKVRSLSIRNFTREEVAKLYQQHTEQTGQVFSGEAKQMAFELTRGQPWLVNALADQVVREQAPEPATTITAGHIENAKEVLVERRDTHLDSLIERLREPRVRRVLEPLLAGDLILGDRIDDDMAYVEDLGLVERKCGGHIEVANPIYQEVIPRSLAFATQATIAHQPAWYIGDDGRLDMGALLDGFLEFWREHGDALLAAQPYHEVAPHLVLMAFLQRIVNGGGFIDREYAVGSGRIDLCIRWPTPAGLQREALELKIWRDGRPDPFEKGLDQLSRYLEHLGLDHGFLIIFDRRSTALPIAERSGRSETPHAGRDITLLRL